MEDSDDEINDPCDFDVINEQEPCDSIMEETENNNTTIASSTEDNKLNFSEPAYSLKHFFNYQCGDQMAKCS